MDKCGHHNNRHYYFAVKIAIIILFLIFVIIIQTRKGLKTIFVLFAGAMVMTTPGMESSSLTREELIIMYFFKGYPYKLIVEFYSWNCVVQETAEKNSQKYRSPEKGTTNSFV